MSDPKKKPVQPQADNEPAPESPGSTSLHDQLAATADERDANYEKYLRSQAELDTMRRRWARELEDQRRFQSLPLVRDLLPALDNLRRAVDASYTGTSVERLREGVELVLKQLDEIFAKHNAQPIPAVGQLFDPNVHEAIQQVPTSEQPPMTVVAEAERGYRLHDRVVRPSKVVVAVEPT
jgi:molecular chaperone GrpE